MRLFSLMIALVLLIPTQGRAGEIETVSIESTRIHRTVKLNVLLPDGYRDDEAKRYPVVYLLHGYGGDYSEWQRVGVVEEAAGLPVIVAMPEGNQSFWVNHHGKEKARWEDYLVEEVIPYVDSHYRTRAAREYRGVSGLSMGGYGAVILGARHPELFSSIASHSGAVGALETPAESDIGKRLAEIFGPSGSDERKGYDPLATILALEKSDRPHIYIDCGSGDFLLEGNRTFVRELAKGRVRYEYRELPGGHTFSYWKRNVRYSLARQLEAFEAAAKRKQELASRLQAAGEILPGLAAVWKTTAETANGEFRHFTLTFSKDGDTLKAKSRDDDQGGEERAWSRVKFEDKSLLGELDIESGGRRGVIRVKAEIDSEGHLSGRWSIHVVSGEVLMGGPWKSKPVVTAASNLDETTLLGTWNLEVAFTEDNVVEYEMRFSKNDGEFGAVLVSPRSGEYKAASASVKNGRLTVRVPRKFGDTKVVMVYTATLVKDQLVGSVTPEGFEDESRQMTFTGKPKSANEASRSGRKKSL